LLLYLPNTPPPLPPCPAWLPAACCLRLFCLSCLCPGCERERSPQPLGTI
jgi:hypothetical protein